MAEKKTERESEREANCTRTTQDTYAASNVNFVKRAVGPAHTHTLELPWFSGKLRYRLLDSPYDNDANLTEFGRLDNYVAVEFIRMEHGTPSAAA